MGKCLLHSRLQEITGTRSSITFSQLTQLQLHNFVSPNNNRLPTDSRNDWYHMAPRFNAGRLMLPCAVLAATAVMVMSKQVDSPNVGVP